MTLTAEELAEELVKALAAAPIVVLAEHCPYVIPLLTKAMVSYPQWFKYPP